MTDLHHIDPERALRQEPQVVSTSQVSEADYNAMLKDNRTWGFWLLGLGVLHLVTSGIFSAPWGVLLILVGAAAFLFKTASMFVIYASTMVWAAVSNMLAGEIQWFFFALVQLYFTYRIIRSYRRYRNLEADYNRTSTGEMLTNDQKAGRFFPWLGLLTGVLSLVGLVAMILGIILAVILTEGAAEVPGFLDFIEGLLVNGGLLGVAFGLASLLSKYRLKGLAIAGLVGGALTVGLELALILLL